MAGMFQKFQLYFADPTVSELNKKVLLKLCMKLLTSV